MIPNPGAIVVDPSVETAKKRGPPQRPACRACSRPVTCAITPSNEYRVEWEKAAWPSLLSINTWLHKRNREMRMAGIRQMRIPAGRC